MIDLALMFLRDQLNAVLAAPVLSQPPAPGRRLSRLRRRRQSGPRHLKLGGVTELLINVEQEPILRAANPYQRVAPDGTAYQTRPDIRLNLCVLFVARYKQYEQSLAQLSRIIRYFQAHPVLDATMAPSMPPDIERLTMELLTLPLSEQNDLWNALRTTYQPSVLYRVRMLVFEDQQAAVTASVSNSTRSVVHAG